MRIWLLQRVAGDFVLLGVPIFPAFPGVAAGPSGHDQNAEPVGLFEKFFVVDAAFEPNGVQAHVVNVRQIGVERARATSAGT